MERKVEIMLASVAISDRQAQLHDYCVQVCSPESYTEEMQNIESSKNLLAEAQSLVAPAGYENSNEAFVSAIQIESDTTTRVAWQMIGSSEFADLMGTAGNQIARSTSLMPAASIKYQNNYYDEYYVKYYEEHPNYSPPN